MLQWQGKRTIAVVTACMTRDGLPEFRVTEVEVTFEEYQNGHHYELVEDRLANLDGEEPYVHFAEDESPAFLHPAVRLHLATQAPVAQLMKEIP